MDRAAALNAAGSFPKAERVKASRIRSRTAATDDEAAADQSSLQLPTPEEFMKQTFFFQDQS